MPSEQLVAPDGGGAQMPSVPEVIWQSPEQQVEPWLQTSPLWMQNDAPNWQVPLLHRLEQHWVLLEQGLPAVLQAAFRAWHTPASQFPLQQAADPVQLWSSAMHAAALHLPEVQAIEQHSVDATQGFPAAVHWLIEEAHVLEVGSQMPEQQSAPDAHCCPNSKQKGELEPPAELLAAPSEVAPPLA